MQRNITIDDEVWAALQELAVQNGTNASEEVRRAIDAYLILHRKVVQRQPPTSLRRQHPPSKRTGTSARGTDNPKP